MHLLFICQGSARFTNHFLLRGSKPYSKMAKTFYPPDNWFPLDLAKESEKLLQQKQTSYPHKSGIGDLRENIFREFLVRRLPQTIEAAKGHIADSDCRRTSEFDIVLFNPLARLVLAEAGEGRYVLPVESVRAVIEVRSRLDGNAIQDAENKLSELASLKRYYMDSEIGRILFEDSGSLQCFRALEHGSDMLPIQTFLVGYESCAAKTIVDEMTSAGGLLDGVLVIGENYFHHDRDTGAVEDFCSDSESSKLLSLPFFMIHLTGSLMQHHSIDALFVPRLAKYLDIPPECRTEDK